MLLLKDSSSLAFNDDSTLFAIGIIDVICFFLSVDNICTFLCLLTVLVKILKLWTRCVLIRHVAITGPARIEAGTWTPNRSVVVTFAPTHIVILLEPEGDRPTIGLTPVWVGRNSGTGGVCTSESTEQR